MVDYSDVEPVERVPTGITGFESITLGGLVRGRNTLLVGTSGSGKTLFALELAYRCATRYDRPVVFATFEERPEDLVRNVKAFDWDLPALIRRNRLTFLDACLDRTTVAEAGRFDLSGILSQIRAAVVELKAEVVILDSLGALFFHYNAPDTLRREIVRIGDALREMGVTGLMTAERLQEYGPVSRFGIEEFVSDCVVVLRHHLSEEKVRRTIQIHKLRGDRHLKDEFPFTIQQDGINILPLSSAELTQESSRDRISFGNGDLDAMAGGGLFHDSVILVSGPTGTGKTLMASIFVAEACRQGERALYLGFEESRPQLIRNTQSWGVDFTGWEREGLLRVECNYPESQGLEGHLYSIRRQIEEYAPSRLVIDSISALERVGQMRNFREFVIALTGYVKQRQICSLFVSSSPRLSGGDSITDAHISTITDAILLVRYMENHGALSRGVIIIKMRGSQHDKHFHEFTISDKGMQVGNAFRHLPGALLGIPSASEV